MKEELSRAHRWFPIVALAITLALFGYSLGSPAYLDEVARLETDMLSPSSALDGRLSFTREDASGYWARQYGIDRYLSEVHGSQTLEVYAAPLPAALEALVVGLIGAGLPLLRLIQLLLHAAVGIMVFRTALRHTSNGRAALLAGILFAAHPCHTVPATTLAGLGPVMAALFALLSIEFFEVSAGRVLRRRFSLAAYLLACLSDMSVVLLPLYMLWRAYATDDSLENRRRNALRSTRQIFAAALLLLILRAALWPSESGVNSLEWWYFIKPFERYSFWLLTVLQTLFYYFAIIPPVPVSIKITAAGQWGLAIALSLAFLALVPYLARRLADRSTGGAYLLFWIFAFGLIGSKPSFEASYLPSVAVSLALGGLAAHIFSRSGRTARIAKWALPVLLLFYLPPSVMHAVEAQAMWRVGGSTAQQLAERLTTIHPDPARNETIYLFNVWPGGWYFDRRVRTLYGRDDIKVRLMTVDPFPATEGSPLPQDLFTSQLSDIYRAFRGVNELEVSFADSNVINARMISGCFFANIMDWSPQYFFSFPPMGEKHENADFSARATAADQRNMPTALEFTLRNPDAPAAFFLLEDGEWKSIERP